MEKIETPVTSILVYFAKLCIGKKEHPCIINNLQYFFYKIKKDFPKVLGGLSYDEDRYSEKVEWELSNLMGSGILGFWMRNPCPYEPRKIILSLDKDVKRKYKKDLKKISEKLYEELGCNKRGELGKHSKFNSIDELL